VAGARHYSRRRSQNLDDRRVPVAVATSSQTTSCAIRNDDGERAMIRCSQSGRSSPQPSSGRRTSGAGAIFTCHAFFPPLRRLRPRMLVDGGTQLDTAG
jgi:hypothetical protein